MEQTDSASESSSDSVNTNEEFEIVSNIEPELKIGGDGSVENLKQSLQEVLMDNAASLGENKVSQQAPQKICVNSNSNKVQDFHLESFDAKMPTGLENKCRADSLDICGSTVQANNSSPGDENKSQLSHRKLK